MCSSDLANRNISAIPVELSVVGAPFPLEHAAITSKSGWELYLQPSHALDVNVVDAEGSVGEKQCIFTEARLAFCARPAVVAQTEFVPAAMRSLPVNVDVDELTNGVIAHDEAAFVFPANFVSAWTLLSDWVPTEAAGIDEGERNLITEKNSKL